MYEKGSRSTHVMEDGEPLSGGVRRPLLLLSPKVLLLGRLQAHSDHLRAGQHLRDESRHTSIGRIAQKLLASTGGGKPERGGEAGCRCDRQRVKPSRRGLGDALQLCGALPSRAAGPSCCSRCDWLVYLRRASGSKRLLHQDQVLPSRWSPSAQQSPQCINHKLSSVTPESGLDVHMSGMQGEIIYL